MSEYPKWICHICGDKYGNGWVAISSWHAGTCDVCERDTAVTEPKNCGHLKPWLGE
ncbi:MAG: hypothetical protein WC455_29970 [Dehalococcoidia bacterium]|jgi:hypothetical protein